MAAALFPEPVVTLGWCRLGYADLRLVTANTSASPLDPSSLWLPSLNLKVGAALTLLHVGLLEAVQPCKPRESLVLQMRPHRPLVPLAS